MVRIDAHQHFWRFDPERDAWIGDDVAALRRGFLPMDLRLILPPHDFAGRVAVQASQTEAETDFLLKLAGKHDLIKTLFALGSSVAFTKT